MFKRHAVNGVLRKRTTLLRTWHTRLANNISATAHTLIRHSTDSLCTQFSSNASTEKPNRENFGRISRRTPSSPRARCECFRCLWKFCLHTPHRAEQRSIWSISYSSTVRVERSDRGRRRQFRRRQCMINRRNSRIRKHLNLQHAVMSANRLYLSVCLLHKNNRNYSVIHSPISRHRRTKRISIVQCNVSALAWFHHSFHPKKKKGDRSNWKNFVRVFTAQCSLSTVQW